MTDLDNWLLRATRCLAPESSARVRAEITDHFEASRDAAIDAGATAQDAEDAALHALGSPAEANRLYRRSLLTSSEARLLRTGNWEARAVCSRSALRWTFLAVPPIILIAGLLALLFKAHSLAFILLPASLCLAVLLHGPFLPVYTPVRSRIYRGLKWTALLALLLMATMPLSWSGSWICFGCWWFVIWIEWQRFSIRRKLPVGQWPRQLHL